MINKTKDNEIKSYIGCGSATIDNGFIKTDVSDIMTVELSPQGKCHFSLRQINFRRESVVDSNYCDDLAANSQIHEDNNQEKEYFRIKHHFHEHIDERKQSAAKVKEMKNEFGDVACDLKNELEAKHTAHLEAMRRRLANRSGHGYNENSKYDDEEEVFHGDEKK